LKQQLLITVPVVMANLLLSFIVNDYWLNLISYSLIYGIVAISLGFLLHIAGLISLAHIALFTIGAYTVALLNLSWGVYDIDLLIIYSFLTSLTASAVIGLISCRYTKLHFIMLTFALSEVIHAIIHYTYGATGLPIPLVVSQSHQTTIMGITIIGQSRLAFLRMYFFNYLLLWFAVTALTFTLIRESPFGKALKAVKNNEERSADVGLNIYWLRTIGFAASGTFTGVAGGLWAVISGLVDPHMIHWDAGMEFLAYAVFIPNIVIGPYFGAMLLSVLREWSGLLTIHWRLILGVFLMLFMASSSKNINLVKLVRNLGGLFK
jgi:branched-chain amino acid transport system permease protein